TKPLNQSYNYINHTVNVTTSAGISSCRYLFNASVQGQKWARLNASAAFPARVGVAAATTPNGRIWLMGGYDGSLTYYNDVWYSDDGANWIQANASAAWEPRYWFSAIARPDGSLWIMGGWNSSGSNNFKNDIWNSTDGANWTLVNRSAAWEPRYAMSAVMKSDGSFWLMGGQNLSFGENFANDVWNSTNGADWTLVNSSAGWSKRYGHASITTSDNRIWVMGGYNNTGDYLRDIWYSSNGADWLVANRTPLWGGRTGHSSVVTPDGRMWVLGGFHNIMGSMNDVYYSSDGANWSIATASAEWPGRYLHSSVVALNSSLLVIAGYGSGLYNDVWRSLAPVTLDQGGIEPPKWGKKFNATEGNNLIGVECNDSSNIWNSTSVVFYVDSLLPAVTISNPLNTTYNASSAPVAANATVSETASQCLFSLNGAANLTMNGSGTEWGVTFMPDEGNNLVVISCNDTIDWRNST
ncbi:MAG: hypothetical protein QME12_09410, partial [Nanoarchaeota archaeon]|nr:hypothetical protein [Nanoarchaeota archaeon]